MRIILTATVATLLLAQPAFAQNSNAGAAPGSPQAGQSMPQMQNPQQAQNPQISAKLQKSLQDAGFTDVQIMPSSFLVRAKGSRGQPGHDGHQSRFGNGGEGNGKPVHAQSGLDHRQRYSPPELPRIKLS
jgi:hypothetical protein